MVSSSASNKVVRSLQSTVGSKKRRRKFSIMDSSDTVKSVSEDTHAVSSNLTHSESIISLSDTLDTSISESKNLLLGCPVPSVTKNSDDIIVTLSDSDSDTESDSSLEIIEENKCVDLTELDYPSKNLDNDDSVIVISDSPGVRIQPVLDHFRLDRAPDFIPVAPSISGRRKLKVENYKKRKRLRTEKKGCEPKLRKTLPSTTSRSREPTSLRTLPPASNGNQEQYQGRHQTPLIQLSYPNILNDNTENALQKGLRPIIIDGCNVGFGYGKGDFVMRGLLLVIQYFKNRGHDEIVCFLPQRYRHRVRSPSEERTVSNLEKENMFSYTPSRVLDNGKKYIPYDDRYILQYATERQGVIISNDGYRDLIDEEPSWRETIEKRIVNYTFARDIFMLPKDPLGPTGPTLDEVLKFPLE